ncbi:hypothetical protein OC835_000799 [Tilletia horrida]|nr:hypothetical protein OC835_000799 [Tilletia horrida]
MPGMQRGFLTSPRRPPAPAAAAASASPALSPSAPAPASSSAPAPAPAPAPAGNDNSVMDVVKATLGTQQPTALGAIEHLKTSLKATLRADPSAKTANLSQNDARNLYAVAVWLEEAVLREQHNPATSTLEARLSALTKVLDRNTTELTKVRTTLASRPVAPVELDDELLVEQELGVAPPVAAASTWAAVTARRKPGPPKVPLEQRMDPAECLLKRSGTADPAFTGLNPAQKVVKLRESIRASLPSDTSDSAIQAADPAKLVRAVRPLPSGDLVVVSSSADHSTLLKQHAAQWLPRATSSLGLHNPRWGVVIHRVPISFSPSSPTSVAALRADNEHLIPADAEISWLSPPPPDGSKKHGSIVAQLPSLAQANKVIEAGIAFDGRLLRVEKEAFDAAKLRALRFGETYTIPPSTSS